MNYLASKLKPVSCLLVLAALILNDQNIIYAQEPEWSWATAVHGNQNDMITAVDFDTRGNTLIGGYFWSPAITIGDTLLVKAEGQYAQNFYIAVIDANGNTKWAKQFYGKDDIYEGSWLQLNSAVFDIHGNVCVSGWCYENKLYADSLILNAEYSWGNSFVLQFSPEGKLNWFYRFTDNYVDLTTLVSDKNGGLYCNGNIPWPNTNIQPGNSDLTHHNINYGMIHLNDAGEPDRYWPVSENYHTIGALHQQKDRTWFFGNFNYDSLNFGGINIINEGDEMLEYYFGNFDNEGNVIEAKPLSAGAEVPVQYVPDDNGIDIFGTFSDDYIVFGEDTVLNNASGNGRFHVRFDNDGNVLYAESVPEIIPVQYIISRTPNGEYSCGITLFDTLNCGTETLIQSEPYADPAMLTLNNALEPVAGFSIPLSNYTLSPPTAYWDRFGNLMMLSTLYGDTLVYGMDTLINYQLSTQPDYYIAKSNNCSTVQVDIIMENNLLVAPDGISWQWYKNDIVISGATNKTYQPVSIGTYRVAVKQSSGCTVWSKDLIIQFSLDDGVPVYVYPNPSAGNITLNVPVPFDECNVYNTLGQVIASWNGAQYLDATLYIESPGIYYAVAKGGNKLNCIKFIIQ